MKKITWILVVFIIVFLFVVIVFVRYDSNKSTVPDAIPADEVSLITDTMESTGEAEEQIDMKNLNELIPRGYLICKDGKIIGHVDTEGNETYFEEEQTNAK